MVDEPVTTTQNCPRCKEGKLVKRVVPEDEADIPLFVLMSMPLCEEAAYTEYTCSRNCGYKDVQRD